LSVAGNLTINLGAAQEIRFATGTTARVHSIGGDLNIQNGIVVGSNGSSAAGSATLTIGGKLNITGGTFRGTNDVGDATVSVGGHIINAGTWQQDDGSSTGLLNFTLNGGSSQDISGANAISFENLTINNGSGVTLSRNIDVTGTLTLTSGNIATSTNTLTVASAGTVSRTSGHVVGNLLRAFAAAGSKTFDVGTANGYSPVAVNASSGTFPANFTVKAIESSLPGISGANKLARYWTLTNTTVSNANLTFTYLPTDITGTIANYQFIKNSAGAFTTLAPAATPTTTTASINGVTSFSDWTLAEPTAVQSGSLQFSAANYNDGETNADHTATITVTRTGGSDGVISVGYGTSDGSATLADNDYVTSSGTLNWNAGEAADKTFTVNVKGDVTPEPDETVNLTLGSPTGGAVLSTPNPATLTITNDDTSGTYTWNGTASTDWGVPINWTPARILPNGADVLIINGTITPAPLITSVPTQTIGALRLTNGASPTLNASAIGAPQTLTISGGTGSDLNVPAPSFLTVAGANGLTIKLSGLGTVGTISGGVLQQGGFHRLFGDANGVVTFQSGAIGTSGPGLTSNPFGTGTAGDASPGSVVFASGSAYFHNAGASPFGTQPAAVVVFQTGSLATFLTATGFDANGRTYANLAIGQTDPSGVAVTASASGTGNFQFDDLIIASPVGSNSSLTYNGSGASAVNIRGNVTSNGAGLGTVQDVILTAGTGGININKIGGGTLTFGNDGNNTRGIDFESSATVTSGTTLTLARKLLLGISQPNGLVMTVDGDIAGGTGGYVIGTLKKSVVTEGFIFPVGTINGYSPVQLTSISGSGDFSARAVQALIPGLGLPGLTRYWTLSGAVTSTNLKFTYLDADIGGNEANYRIVKDTNGAGDPFSFPDGGADDVDEANNTATTLTPVSSFSNWSIVEPNAPTAVKLTSFRAVKNNGEVMLQWQSGYEARNLGYQIYREQDGKRVAITPSLVAGSALVAGRQTKLGAGLSYTWYDQDQKGSVKGNAPAVYWLEDIDLNGTRTLHGPIVPEISYEKSRGRELRADLIGEVSRRSTPQAVQINGWASGAAHSEKGSNGAAMFADPSDIQHDLAGMPGVKLAVSSAGWYRVSQTELAAAGFTVQDARQLQLYRNGREVALSLSNGGNSFTTTDYLEFYGEGLDSPTSAVQTYYLVNGRGNGARINSVNGNATPAEPSGPQSFDYTVERKERMIYFSGLRNGDAENFFGQIVSSDPVSASMPVSNLAGTQAELEIVLQGVTNESHLVEVVFNGAHLGTLNFANTDHPSAKFTVPASALHEGDNAIELTSMGGASDVSLIDVLRLTYNRSLVATDNALSFSVNSRDTRRISGFTNPNVRVLDISDTSAPFELKASVSPDAGAYAVLVDAKQASALNPRTLLAIAGGQARQVDAVRANVPSALWTKKTGADYVLITTAELLPAFEPLAQLRRNQGMAVAVVDVEDVYDEFSFGKHSPEALRDFLQRAVKSWKRQPHFVLFAGDASYDPKNYLGQGLNDLLPTKLVDTALTETASDDWLADFNRDGIADLAIGRLPVRTLGEASQLVAKIINYENSAVDPTRNALLVADTSFEATSSAMKNVMPAGQPVQLINRSATDDLTAHSQIIAGLNQGPRLANYFGHGSNGIWSGAGLLSSTDTPSLTNTNRLSVFTMMTCFNGYFHDAYNESLSEALLKSQGGAVAVWASTGLTEPKGQNVIGEEFYRLLFGTPQITLGDAARMSKAFTNDADVRRTWTLFGDPATRLK
jgi:hypothetical protein